VTKLVAKLQIIGKNHLTTTMKYPIISVIIPIRNEAQYIRLCLNSVICQDYPADLLEVLVVDGMSDDGTREIVQQIIDEMENESKNESAAPNNKNKEHRRIAILDNPKRIVPTALNLGLSYAKGDVIMRIDGHCEIGPDYIRRCIELLGQTGADNVGGPLKTISDTLVGRAISLATSSVFGVGGVRFRCSTKPSWVDTVFPGVFPRQVFDRIGNFDEELVRNQDDEFNFRLRQSGGKIWLDPSIKISYYARSNFRGLWRQYLQYGFYKVRVIQKRGAVPSGRHLTPAAFVSGLTVTVLLGFITGNLWWALAVSGPYLAANLFASLWTARRDWRTLRLLPVAFLTIHFAYGAGFLWGLWHWRRFW
jgi:succinoglycan biosynthesis protein ExoA